MRWAARAAALHPRTPRAAAAGLVAAALVAGCGGASGGGEPAAPAVVTVLVERPSGVPERATGFVAAPGRVVTVAHVLDGGGAVAIRARGGARRSARVLRVDRAADLALLEARGAGGRDAGSGEVAATGGARLVSPGGARPVTIRRHIRARVRDSAGPQVYSRAALELGGAVSAGDSGAPVLDGGELLGVVFARSRRHDGTAYAVGAAAVDRLLAR